MRSLCRIRRATAIIALAALSCAGCDRGARPGQIGQIAPGFTLSDGLQTVDMGKLRGRVVVLNFWATWCAPCIEELPSLEAMQQDLPQVHVVTIASQEEFTTYQSFLQRNNVGVLSVFDATQKSNALYGSFRFPETYVIDKNGVIRRKFIGAQQWTSPEMLRYLRKLAS